MTASLCSAQGDAPLRVLNLLIELYGVGIDESESGVAV